MNHITGFISDISDAPPLTTTGFRRITKKAHSLVFLD
jgi:hypothetical protein